MSAPKTDLEKQKERHRAPLLGMRSVVLWALALLVLLTIFVAMRGNEPGDEEPAIEGTGAAIPEEAVIPEEAE